MKRQPIARPQPRRDVRINRAMMRARDALFALARIMPHHNGPNADFTRFMVNTKAELIRAGYLLPGDGKGGLAPVTLPTAADLAARMPSSADALMSDAVTISRVVCQHCKASTPASSAAHPCPICGKTRIVTIA